MVVNKYHHLISAIDTFHWKSRTLSIYYRWRFNNSWMVLPAAIVSRCCRGQSAKIGCLRMRDRQRSWGSRIGYSYGTFTGYLIIILFQWGSPTSMSAEKMQSYSTTENVWYNLERCHHEHAVACWTFHRNSFDNSTKVLCCIKQTSAYELHMEALFSFKAT